METQIRQIRLLLEWSSLIRACTVWKYVRSLSVAYINSKAHLINSYKITGKGVPLFSTITAESNTSRVAVGRSCPTSYDFDLLSVKMDVCSALAGLKYGQNKIYLIDFFVSRYEKINKIYFVLSILCLFIY